MNYLPLIFISTLFTTRAANCPCDVWWLYVAPGTTNARIWGRTGCNFDASGKGSCQTGDCGGLTCTGWGVAPNTLAEYVLNQYNNYDYLDISLVAGFNIPMEFGPTNNVGGDCKLLKCAADINEQCPGPLRVPGGCNDPCSTFKEERYCCNNGPCGPTDYSKFFKDRCPSSYSYPQDHTTGTNFACPGCTNYKVVFCP